jgi:lauroyl-KDO2-lipid IV(A) myristoyltransferase
MEQSHRATLEFPSFRPRFWPTWSVLGALWLLAWLPHRVRALLADGAAWLRERVDPKRTRIILTNLALCYPHLSEAERRAIASAHLRISTRAYLDSSVLMFRSPRVLERMVDIVGYDALIRGAEDGIEPGSGNESHRRFILVSPHTPALEHCGLRLSLDHPMVTMIRRHKNPVSDWIVTRMRTRYDGRLFRHDAPLMGLIRELRRGRWFYYLPDEDQGHPSAVFAPFMGVPKATVPVLGRIARAAGALIVPTRSAIDLATGRYTLYLGTPREWPSYEAPIDEGRALNAMLESLIDEDRAQYLWTQKIFRTRPPGVPAYY